MEVFHKKANKLYYNKKYDEAINIYNLLIENNYKINIIYSNRAACFLQIKDYLKALNDSLKSVELDLNYSKAWGRVGYSYKGLKMDMNASKAFEIALKFDNNNKLYEKEIELYFNKYSNKINFTSVCNLLKDKKIFNDLKKIKNEILNTKSDKILNNKNIINFIDDIIHKL
jgi:tetratricopeptide (TPR) repeat protein